MSSKKYYPIAIDIENAPCLVVGGGTVAERKISTLLQYGAKVTVVAPRVTPDIQLLADTVKIQLMVRRYQSADIPGNRVVIGATDNPIVNEAIYNDAVQCNVLVNIVDDPEHCVFIVPAVGKKKNIQVTVNTGGGAPGIAGVIRDKIDLLLEDEWDDLVALLKKLRPRIKKLPQKYRDSFWNEIRAIDVLQFKELGSLSDFVEQKLSHFE